MQTADNKLKYIECVKEGFHYGEVLNMVCLEKTCLQNLACCCACIESEHKKHLTKPLRMVMTEAKQHSESIKTAKFNIDVILDIINTSKKETFEVFGKYKKQIEHNLSTIQNSLNAYYNSTIQQIIMKSSDPKIELQKAFDVIYAPKNIEEFKASIKRIVAMMPSKNQEESGDLNEETLIHSIKSSNEEVNGLIKKKIDEVNKKLEEYEGLLQTSINTLNIWKGSESYKFSSTLKHGDVKLLSDYIVKSANNSGYKFAIMEPSLQKGTKIKNFTFKIKESSSNWIAIGMCHKKIVEGKSYGFNFGSIGHGGYMISANGGSWSNSKVESNNSVKAFKFAKGDIITVSVDIEKKKMIFKKKFQTYELLFETIVGDELHPCVLFYYINDEVEFLENYKE